MQGKKRGAASTWHAFLSKRFRGSDGLVPSTPASCEYQRIKQENGEEWRDLQELAILGNRAHQVGGHAFGHKPPPASSAKPPRVEVPGQAVFDVNTAYSMVPYDNEDLVVQSHRQHLTNVREARKMKVAEEQEATRRQVDELRDWVGGSMMHDDVHRHLPVGAVQPVPCMSPIVHHNHWSCPRHGCKVVLAVAAMVDRSAQGPLGSNLAAPRAVAPA